MFGFIEGFRFIVPIGNSQSKALSEAVPPSERHPLELEDDARECLPLLISELATLALLEVVCAGLLIQTAALPLVLVGIDVIEHERAWAR